MLRCGTVHVTVFYGSCRAVETSTTSSGLRACSISVMTSVGDAKMGSVQMLTSFLALVDEDCDFFSTHVETYSAPP